MSERSNVKPESKTLDTQCPEELPTYPFESDTNGKSNGFKSEASSLAVASFNIESDTDNKSNDIKSEASSLVDLGSSLFGPEADMPDTSFHPISSHHVLNLDSNRSSPVNIDSTILPLGSHSCTTDDEEEDVIHSWASLYPKVEESEPYPAPSDQPTGNLPFLDKISDPPTRSQTPPVRRKGKRLHSGLLGNIERLFSRSIIYHDIPPNSFTKKRREATSTKAYDGRITTCVEESDTSSFLLPQLTDDSFNTYLRSNEPKLTSESTQNSKHEITSSPFFLDVKEEELHNPGVASSAVKANYVNVEDYALFDLINKPSPSQDSNKEQSEVTSETYNTLTSLLMPEDEFEDDIGTLDKGVSEAIVESVKDDSILPIIKKELQFKIQHRRMSSGKPELLLVPEQPQVFELTEEEKQKRSRRLQQNRESAQRSRLAQRKKEEDLQERIKKEAKKQGKLLRQKTKLTEKRDHLRQELDEHLSVCPMQKH